MKLSPPTRPSDPPLTSVAEAGARRRLPPATGLRAAKATRRKLTARHWYALLVLLPTLLVATYYVGFAADLYESEARFIVKARGGSGGGGGIGDLGGGRTGTAASIFASTQPGSDESRAVVSFVDSHGAVQALMREVDLIEIWRRPEADLIAKLWWSRPQVEWLLWYFRRRVTTDYDTDTGVLTLRALAFRPDDAKLLADKTLQAAEKLVNDLTQRTINDTLRVAQEDIARAEARVIASREAVAVFREREQAFDPTRTAGGAVDTIGRLEAALTQARADLQEKRAFMRPDNPQVQLLVNRITALQQQIATERGRVTRGDESLTRQVAGFERASLERDFADRQLASATASLEQARTDVLRQQVFLARIADPVLPEWARYPKAAFNTLTVFIGLTVLFGIGWLLAISAREHAS